MRSPFGGASLEWRTCLYEDIERSSYPRTKIVVGRDDLSSVIDGEVFSQGKNSFNSVRVKPSYAAGTKGSF